MGEETTKVEIRHAEGSPQEITINFPQEFSLEWKDPQGLVNLCCKLLSEIPNITADRCSVYGYSENQLFDPLRDLSIQFLEGKYGLKVKICGNCKYFACVRGGIDSEAPTVGCKYHKEHGQSADYHYLTFREMINGCKLWAPKEIPEKPLAPPVNEGKKPRKPPAGTPKLGVKGL